MLNLSVSTQPCIPGRSAPDAGPRPLVCSTCGAPGGKQGSLLEKHLVGGGKARYLCPLCHAVLHLDVAGKMKAGRIVWIPELTQAQLNVLSLSAFVALRKAGVHRDNPEVKAIAEHARRLYKSFEKRSEAVESFLGGNATKSPLPRSAMSTPTHVASLIVRAQRESKLDARTVAKRIDGLRLLPNPAAFDAYISQVSRIMSANFPVDQWTQAANDELDLSTKTLTESGSEHFDASADADVATAVEAQ